MTASFHILSSSQFAVVPQFEARLMHSRRGQRELYFNIAGIVRCATCRGFDYKPSQALRKVRGKRTLTNTAVTGMSVCLFGHTIRITTGTFQQQKKKIEAILAIILTIILNEPSVDINNYLHTNVC